jgi:hypothetical protein
VDIRIGDKVKCSRLGPGKYKVVGEDDAHYVLETGHKTTQTMFKVHCHPLPVREAIVIRRQRIADKIAAAEKIGRKTK